ncbi:hypothetical protein [Luteibacter rhizovicinus]|uniref:hypothetical protein n=1 Tax=Luteibacter rhizovicinus TaxID=242606 RepID=UPI001051D009|nr:hypothetical protein [Luteibacter rhizovicinus]
MTLLVMATSIGGVHAQQRVLMPTVYEAGHFYAVPKMPDGKNLRLIVDTGGGGGSGFYVIEGKAAQRLKLPVTSCAIGDEHADVVGPIPFVSGKGLPVVPGTPCGAVALVTNGGGSIDGEDGQLGAGYLPRYTWTFDYLRQQLWLEPTNWRPAAVRNSHKADLGLLRNAQGRIATGMARITLLVDGHPLQMLLDTGATAKPTKAGAEASGTPTIRGTGVTSYVITSVFDSWRRLHPDWRVVIDGDELAGKFTARLIEVPKVQIAGWTIGPVWFTERPDAAFSTADGHMSSYTDEPVQGAVGANVFMHFAMTLDYSSGKAWFACEKACNPSQND